MLIKILELIGMICFVAFFSVGFLVIEAITEYKLKKEEREKIR